MDSSLLSYCLPNQSLAVSFRDFILLLSRDSVGPAKAARRAIQSWIVRSGIFATFSAMRVAITSMRRAIQSCSRFHMMRVVGAP
jgi:hypothetical protein